MCGFHLPFHPFMSTSADVLPHPPTPGSRCSLEDKTLNFIRVPRRVSFFCPISHRLPFQVCLLALPLDSRRLYHGPGSNEQRWWALDGGEGGGNLVPSRADGPCSSENHYFFTPPEKDRLDRVVRGYCKGSGIGKEAMTWISPHGHYWIAQEIGGQGGWWWFWLVALLVGKSFVNKRDRLLMIEYANSLNQSIAACFGIGTR